MRPRLEAIDHIHLYVSDKAKAVAWYEDVLGFKVVKKYQFWSEGGGPLTLADASGSIHLALFERKEFDKLTSVAFRASGDEYLKWRQHLQEKGSLRRESDHNITWSLYFEDPFGHQHEITTTDYEQVSKLIKS